MKQVISNSFRNIAASSFLFLVVNMPFSSHRFLAIGIRPTPPFNFHQMVASSDAKLRICKIREEMIKTKMKYVPELATEILNKFDSIATRVENYYNLNLVPNGKTLSNYDSLVSEIQAKKSAVKSALSKAQDDANSFSCANENPKGDLAKFRSDMSAVREAFKKYRKSVRNLIVAVKSLVGKTQSSPNPSP